MATWLLITLRIQHLHFQDIRQCVQLIRLWNIYQQESLVVGRDLIHLGRIVDLLRQLKGSVTRLRIGHNEGMELQDPFGRCATAQYALLDIAVVVDLP